tara:strand:+ start:61785 stop:62087 length:303 start_codon:yes stop_codon:yes gene_type:complete
MNPTHANPITSVRRRLDGSIDYGYYDARARVVRSGAFRAACQTVHLFCRTTLASCLGRHARSRGAVPAADHVAAPPRPQTFLENYTASAQQHQSRFSKAA